MIRLDVPYIFDRAGGPKKLFDALHAQWPGERLQYATVQMWQQRQIISSPWQVPVLYVMRQLHQIDPLTCMTDEDSLGIE